MNTRSASHEQEEQSGRIGQAQKHFWDIFKEYGPLTSREAVKLIETQKGIKYQQRCGRIAELQNMGLIERHSVVVDEVTKKRVNTWICTGRTTPLPCSFTWVECKYCEGHGGKYKRAYIHESGTEKQLEMY